MILLLLASVVVYQSAPQRHLAAQGSSAGADQLYVTDSGKLWRLGDGNTVTEIAPLTATGCNLSSAGPFFGMATAPDGTVYALSVCATDQGNTQWGRFDPETAVFTPIGPLANADDLTTIGSPARVNFGVGFRIAFLPQFGAPGTPIGYRIKYHQGSLATNNPPARITLYAIDAIAPYREHMIDINIAPAAFNVGIGFFLSGDGPTIYPVTTNLIYQMQVPEGQTVANFMSIDALELSPDAQFASNMDADGNVNVFDGVARWLLNRVTKTLSSRVQLPVNFIEIAVLRPAPLGGVRVEPHEQLITSESGTMATFTAVLTAQPTADVTVTFTSSDTSEGTVSPSSAVFTTANWKSPRTITVTGVADSDTTDQAFSIVTASTSPDPNYHGRGILDVDITNTHVNQLPALAAGTPSVRQGSPAAGGTLGTVSDLETAAGSLTVAAITVPSGVIVGTITNTTGTITAPLSASCSATTGGRTVGLRVTDAVSATTDQSVTVTVLANTAPTIGTYNATTVTLNGSTSVTSGAVPADNGNVASVTVTPGTFTGTLSVNPLTGAVSISSAAPAGVHTVTVIVEDNCGATLSRTIALTVNTVPTLSTGTPSARRGSPATAAALGMVGDAETSAGSLTVATVTVPSGLTVGTITNSGGAITAPLMASCSATLGSNALRLRVTDGHGATADHDVTVTVLANTAPTVGIYASSTAGYAGNTTVTPSAGPADNGSLSMIATSPAFTGSLSSNDASGVVAVSNAGPAGGHTVTVTVTDNCSAETTTTFTLTVSCPTTSLGASGASFTLGGGSGSVGVKTDPGCAWTTSGDASWVAVVNGSGNGSGTATFFVAENRSGAARNTNFTIGGQSFAVAQSIGIADAVMIAGVTPVRALHVIELRVGIDLQRARFGLAGYGWTDAGVMVGITPIRAVHISELRAALVQAYAAADRTSPAFTDATIDTATPIRAVHLNELRAAVTSLEGTQ